MGTVNAKKSCVDFVEEANQKLNGISGTTWLSFLDAVGWVEGDNNYNAANGKGFYGIYQQGIDQLNYMNFFNSFGSVLNVGSLSEFQHNPVAQEMAALMEFAGVPSALVGKAFTSKYNATLRGMSDYVSGSDSSAMLSALMGKTFTIRWVGTDLEQTFTMVSIGVASRYFIKWSCLN